MAIAKSLFLKIANRFHGLRSIATGSRLISITPWLLKLLLWRNHGDNGKPDAAVGLMTIHLANQTSKVARIEPIQAQSSICAEVGVLA